MNRRVRQLKGAGHLSELTQFYGQWFTGVEETSLKFDSFLTLTEDSEPIMGCLFFHFNTATLTSLTAVTKA